MKKTLLIAFLSLCSVTAMADLSIIMEPQNQTTVSINADGIPIIGIPLWNVNQGDPLIKPSQDGFSCQITAQSPGFDQVQVLAQADPQSGLGILIGLVDITVKKQVQQDATVDGIQSLLMIAPPQFKVEVLPSISGTAAAPPTK